MASYKTVKNQASFEFCEKRSRFIGYVRPVKTVDEANAFIDEIKKMNYDAKHNVFAYILNDGAIKKYSDDGEPQGTAGVPVLDVIQKNGLTDVCIVVTRYFGGILLGGGGLVRAYSHTASLTLDAAEEVTMKLCSVFSVSCDYNFYGRLPAIISENDGITDNADFEESVTVLYHIPTENSQTLSEQIFDMSNGKIKPTFQFEKFYEIKQN